MPEALDDLAVDGSSERGAELYRRALDVRCCALIIQRRSARSDGKGGSDFVAVSSSRVVIYTSATYVVLARAFGRTTFAMADGRA